MSRFEALVGFIQQFVNWAASDLVGRKELKRYAKWKIVLSQRK